MSLNKYQEHLFVLPEDEANEKIAHGFTLFHEIANRKINVLPIVGGWLKVLDDFKKVHLSEMQNYPKRLMVLLIDFDNEYEEKIEKIKVVIPTQLQNRVFVLGVLDEPEKLNSRLGFTGFETIGQQLAKDCYEQKIDGSLWAHDHLKHNIPEIQRMQQIVRPFLFISN